MKSTINLALGREKSKKKIDFALFPLIVFGGVFVISTFALSLNQFTQFQIDSLTVQENQIRNNINNLTNKKIKYLTIKERTGSISLVLNKRDPLNKNITNIIENLPDALQVTQIDAKEKEVFVTVSSPDLLLLNQLLETNIADFAKLHKNSLKKVNVEKFELDQETGGYALTLGYEFVK